MSLMEEKVENLGDIAIKHVKARFEAERQLQIYKNCLNNILRQHEWRNQTQAIAVARQVVREMEAQQ